MGHRPYLLKGTYYITQKHTIFANITASSGSFSDMGLEVRRLDPVQQGPPCGNAGENLDRNIKKKHPVSM